MKYIFPILSFAVVAISACSPDKAADSDPNQMFADAKRRNLSAEEAKMVVRLTGGCTGFYIRNSRNKVLIGSARHCAEFQVHSGCRKGLLDFEDQHGRKGKCIDVVVASNTHDIFIYEASFKEFNPQDHTALSLAHYVPTVKTPLKLLGFPADKFREGAPTATTNCSVLSNNKPNPHPEKYVYPNGQVSMPTLTRSGHHNCSVYGGNSGGPLLFEGYKEVVGLPSTYHPDDYKKWDSKNVETAAMFDQMEHFVSDNLQILKQLGVSLVEKQGDTGAHQTTAKVPEKNASNGNPDSKETALDIGERYFSPIVKDEFILSSGSDMKTVVATLPYEPTKCKKVMMDKKFIGSDAKSVPVVYVAYTDDSGTHHKGYIDRNRLREKECGAAP